MSLSQNIGDTLQVVSICIVKVLSKTHERSFKRLWLRVFFPFLFHFQYCVVLHFQSQIALLTTVVTPSLVLVNSWGQVLENVTTLKCCLEPNGRTLWRSILSSSVTTSTEGGSRAVLGGRCRRRSGRRGRLFIVVDLPIKICYLDISALLRLTPTSKYNIATSR